MGAIMARNNGAARKAWRRESANFNREWWTRFDHETPAPMSHRAVYIISKPYTRSNRPAKPDTDKRG